MISRKRNKNWTLKEQSLYLSRIGNLLDQGYSFEQASQFLLFQLPKKHNRDIEVIIESCKQGESLYTAFSKVGFHKDILGYLYFAEQHGDISFALREGSTMLQKKIVHFEKGKKIIRYPLALLMFVGFMFTMIEKILLPQFQSLFTSMSYEQTLISKILLRLPELNRYLLLIVGLLLIIGLTYYFLHFQKLTPVEKMKLLLKIPILKKVTVMFNSHFFSVQLSNLLKGGLSIFQALTMFEQQLHSPFFREEAKEMKQLLRAGNRFEDILRVREYYEADLAMIILHGQSNGNLASELQHYSQYVMEKAEENVTRLLAVVQPILFATIGIIIILMYAAIMVPMFQLLNGI
ncbi:competence type IV pilus assembly protein ComGB [Ferdinandcohnia sp. SAFN-114]|uniref:competence type IV pilus assembly protein ComGB n=1 Tax=Ferdinandcohnia sp. SAFN-114 TaxID=3387275 RepID=UPI003F7D9A18